MIKEIYLFLIFKVDLRNNLYGIFHQGYRSIRVSPVPQQARHPEVHACSEVRVMKKSAMTLLLLSSALAFSMNVCAAESIEMGKEEIEEALNLENISPEWTYSEESDSWTMEIVTAVANAK